MASRFWVGGTGTWDASTTTNWAASSGGAGGASAPTSTDDVFLDGSSGAGTITTAAGATCQNFDCTGYTGTLAFSATLTAFATAGGTVKLAAGMTISGAGLLAISLPTGGTVNFTSAGKTVPALQVGGSTSGTCLLADALTVAGAVLLTAGGLNTNGKTCTWGSFSSSNATTRTLTLGASLITLTGSSASAIWDTSTGTNMTVTANTATVTFSGATSRADMTINVNYNGLSLTYTGGGTFTLNGSPTVKDFTVTGTAVKTGSVIFSSAPVFTGTLNVTGQSAVNRILVLSNTVGTPRTLTAALKSLTNVDFQDIAGAGAAAPFTGTSLGDCQGNSGITFDAPAAQSWVGTAGGNWSDVTKWTSRVPLPQDDVTIAAAFVAAQTVTMDMPRLGRGLNFTGMTGAPTISQTVVTTLFGNVVLAGAQIGISASDLILAGRGVQTITSAGGSLAGGGRNVRVRSPGGSYTLQDDLSWGASIALDNGTFSANNKNVTIFGFSSTNTNTRTLTMGSGTWTLTAIGSQSVWNTGTTTGLTFSAGTSTIILSGASGALTFNGGGLTFATVRQTAAGTATLTIFGSNTFGTLDLECSTARTVTLQASGSQMILGTLTIQGAAGQLLSFVSGTPTQQTGLWVVPGGTLTQAFASLSSDVILTSGQNVHAINVITDASRLAALSWGTGQQGGTTDGAPAGSGYRIVRQATNLFRRGQCDATTDWNASSPGTTISTDPTTRAPFSTQSIKAVCDGTSANQGIQPNTGTGQAAPAGTNAPCSCWVKLVAGQSYIVTAIWRNTDATNTIGGSTTITAGDGSRPTITVGGVTYELVTAPVVAVAAGKTGDRISLNVQINGTRAETIWAAHAMIESGQVIVAPYVASSGGTVATWGASRARFYAGLLNLTKAWSFVTRVRVGWSDADSVGFTFNPRFATLENDATHRFTCVYNRGTRTLTFLATNGGANVGPGTLAASLPALNAGDAVTVAGIVDPVAKTLGVSINGAAIVTSAVGADFPTITDPSIDIGTEVGNNPIMGRELWFVLAQRAFSNAEVAAYAALGDSDPDFSANAPVEFWNALAAAYEVPPASVVAPVIA